MFFVKFDTSVTGHPGRVFKNTMRRLFDMLEGIGADGQYSTEQGSAQQVDYGMKLIPSRRVQTLTGASTQLVADVGQIDFISNGLGADNTVVLPAGATLGQRIILKLLTRTHSSDTISIDMTIVEETIAIGETPGNASAYKLDAAGEQVLLEWQGSQWNLLYGNGSLTT